MKYLFTWLGLLLGMSSTAYGQGVKVYEAISRGGYMYSCDYTKTNENHLIREGYLKNIFEAQTKAKEECETNTGKICGIIFWGDYQDAKGQCFGYAKAKVIN